VSFPVALLSLPDKLFYYLSRKTEGVPEANTLQVPILFKSADGLRGKLQDVG
jgi:hypothetical protein